MQTIGCWTINRLHIECLYFSWFSDFNTIGCQTINRKLMPSFSWSLLEWFMLFAPISEPINASNACILLGIFKSTRSVTKRWTNRKPIVWKLLIFKLNIIQLLSNWSVILFFTWSLHVFDFLMMNRLQLTWLRACDVVFTPHHDGDNSNADVLSRKLEPILAVHFLSFLWCSSSFHVFELVPCSPCILIVEYLHKWLVQK